MSFICIARARKDARIIFLPQKRERTTHTKERDLFNSLKVDIFNSLPSNLITLIDKHSQFKVALKKYLITLLLLCWWIYSFKYLKMYVMFFSCLECYNSSTLYITSTLYINVWIYSDVSLLLWTLCFFLVNLSNNLNCTCIYVLYDFWLIPHPVVICLTYGSIECIYVCM
jgi:hypothetical protein